MRRGANWWPAACPMRGCCGCRGWRRATCTSATGPTDPVNRRISIIVMNRDAENGVFMTAPEAPAEAGLPAGPPVPPALPPIGKIAALGPPIAR